MKKMILMSLLFVSSINLFSKEIGKVSFLRGSAWVVRGQDKITATKDLTIHDHDQILTEKRTLLKVELEDKSLFSIGPSSHIDFKNYNANATVKDPSLFQLTHGFLRAKFSEKDKMGEIQVQTQHVSMAIRGTELIVEVFDQNKKPETRVALLSGRVEVHERGPKGDVKEKAFLMKPGFAFDSANFKKRGFEKSFSKMEPKNFDRLKRENNSFMFDVSHKGKDYPKYDAPRRFNNLHQKRESRDQIREHRQERKMEINKNDKMKAKQQNGPQKDRMRGNNQQQMPENRNRDKMKNSQKQKKNNLQTRQRRTQKRQLKIDPNSPRLPRK